MVGLQAWMPPPTQPIMPMHKHLQLCWVLVLSHHLSTPCMHACLAHGMGMLNDDHAAL